MASPVHFTCHLAQSLALACQVISLSGTHVFWWGKKECILVCQICCFKDKTDPGSSPLATNGVVCRSSDFSDWRTYHTPHAFEPAGAVSWGWSHCAFTLGSCQANRLQGRLCLRRLQKSLLQTQEIHSMPLPGKVVQIPLLVLWKEYRSIWGHCSADSRAFSVSAKGVKAVHSFNKRL